MTTREVQSQTLALSLQLVQPVRWSKPQQRCWLPVLVLLLARPQS
jgi:hypothetical protein